MRVIGSAIFMLSLRHVTILKYLHGPTLLFFFRESPLGEFFFEVSWPRAARLRACCCFFFIIYVQHLHNLREEEKLRNSGYLRDLTIIKFEPVLIKKKAWLEIGFLNCKFLSTAGIETMVISAIQNKNSS